MFWMLVGRDWADGDVCIQRGLAVRHLRTRWSIFRFLWTSTSGLSHAFGVDIRSTLLNLSVDRQLCQVTSSFAFKFFLALRC